MKETVEHRPVAPSRRRAKAKWGACIVALSLLGLVAWAQNSKQAQAVKPPAQPSPSTAANTLPPVQLNGQDALHHLNQVISWYRHCTTGIHSVGLPSDAIYQDNTQSLGAQAVRLAFQSARAESALIAAQQKTSGASQPSAETTQQQNLAQVEARTTSRSISCNRRSKV